MDKTLIFFKVVSLAFEVASFTVDEATLKFL